MTMTPDRFRELFADAVAGGPTEVDVASDLAAGRRLLRRRRLAAAAAGTAVVALVGTTYAFAADDLLRGERDPQPAGSHDPVDASMVDRCATHASDLQRAALFDPGTPEVALAETTSAGTQMILKSTDGKAWATCYVADGQAAEVAGFSTGPGSIYDRDTPSFGTIKQFEVGQELACEGGSATCSRFSTRGGDRLPPGVAYVELETVDGQVTRVEVEDGYYVFNLVGDQPDPTEYRFHWVTRITYLDAEAQPVAESVIDVPRPPRPGSGLPGLEDAYPSLMSPLRR